MRDIIFRSYKLRKVDKIIAQHRKMEKDKINNRKKLNMIKNGFNMMAMCPIMYNDQKDVNKCISNIAKHIEKAYKKKSNK